MNILIVNLHSSKNLGDDAIMISTLEGLYRKYHPIKITVSANDPRSWEKYPVDVVNSLCNWVGDCSQGKFRHKLVLMPIYLIILLFSIIIYRGFGRKVYFGSIEQRRLLHAYYHADIVASCGGGVYYSHNTFSPALFWAVTTMLLAKGLGKKTYLFPQSIGVIEGKILKWWTALLLKSADEILVREPFSSDYILNELGIHRDLKITPDLAFCLPAINHKPVPDGSQKSKKVLIGLTLINRGAQDMKFLHQQRYEEAIINSILAFAKKYPIEVNIFCQCSGPSPVHDDGIVSQRIHDLLKQYGITVVYKDSFLGANEIRKAFGEMDFIIGSRFHTTILAMGACVPSYLIAYQHKASGTMTMLGLSQFSASISDVTAEGLFEAMCLATENYSKIRELFKNVYTETHQKALAWIDLLN